MRHRGARGSFDHQVEYHDEGTWWAECNDFPGWSAAADSRAELDALVAEFIEWQRSRLHLVLDLVRHRRYGQGGGMTVWQLPFLGLVGVCVAYLLVSGGAALLRASRRLWERSGDGLNHDLEHLQEWGRSR
jgi:hypothetical protein